MDDDDRWVNTAYGRMRRDDWIDMQFRRADERRRADKASWLKFAKDTALSGDASTDGADRFALAAKALVEIGSLPPSALENPDVAKTLDAVLSMPRLDEGTVSEIATAVKMITSPRPGAKASRRRGRPKGRKYSRQQVIERFAAHAERLGRRPTQEEFAVHLDVRPRTLQGYLTDYGLPWPVE